jgi:uncharacterized delta-60 repeat protein
MDVGSTLGENAMTCQKKGRVSFCAESLEPRRLLSAGALVGSFGSGGTKFPSFAPQTATALAVTTQPDGKIVAVGFTNKGLVALARFNSNGTLDTTFGSGGEVITRYGTGTGTEAATCVAIQSDGKIVVGASSQFTTASSPVFNQGFTFDVLRFNSDGTFDDTFDHDGLVNIPLGGVVNSIGSPRSVAIQPDGKIVLAGFEDTDSVGRNDNFELVRLNPNGSLDSTFGITRTGQTQLGLGNDEDLGAMTIDYAGTPATNSDYGHIVLAGVSVDDDSDTFTPVLAVARFNPNGSLDKTFNGTGSRLIGLSNFQYITASSVTIDNRGDIVTAGQYAVTFDTRHDFGGYLLMALKPNGATDTTFGNKGFVETPFTNGGQAFSIANGLTGQVMVGGDRGLACYDQSGKLVPTFSNSGINTQFKNIVSLCSGGDGTILAASSNFGVAKFQDFTPIISVAEIINTISEGASSPIGFVVTRDQRLPIDTRVYFNIGGTASAPTAFALQNHLADYKLSGLTIPITLAGHPLALPFVDILPDQTSTLVSLLPIDDTLKEGTETAIFTMQSNALYTSAPPTSATINILDNDTATTTQKFAASADAYVQDGSSANTNFGASTKLQVKTGGSGFNRLTYLKFDLSSFSGTPTSVKLQLTGNLSAAGETNLLTQLFSVADTSWVENTIDFNNKPAAGTTALASATIQDTTKRTYTLDITAYVKAQLAAGHKVISLVLKNPASSSDFMTFDSKEAGATGPQLVVS